MKQLLRFLFLMISLALAGKAQAQTAGFTVSPATGCAPQLVYFTNTSTGTITSYSWNFGNGASSILKDPSTTYTSAGTYTVTLTVSFAGGGTASASASITVYAKPAVAFAAGSVLGCRPLQAVFSSTVTPNAPGAATYLWNFGDGSTDTAANPVHIYTTPGIYSVSLTVTSGAGCATTFTKPAYIQVLGNNPFTASPLSACSAPANVTFTTASLSGVTTSWAFGDGGTGSGNTVSHTYMASGSYTVKMMQYFASAGCTDTVTRPAYIQVRGRTSSFSAPAAICVNGVAAFTNTTSVTGAAWNFGDGTTGYGVSIQHTYTSAGTFNVRMITVIGGCADTAFRTITVHPNPRPVINMSPSIPCPPPVTLTFSASGVPAGSTYSWNWASGGSAGVAVASKTYTNGYMRDTVTLLVTSPAGCVGIARRDSIVIPDMLLRKKIRQKPPEGCIPLTINFDSAWLESSYPDSSLYPAAVTSYTWNFGDGSPTSSASSVAHTYTAFGTYIASITITTANGCSITDTVHIHAGTKIPPSYTVLQDSVCIAYGQLVQNTTFPAAPLYNWGLLPFGGPPWVPHATYQRLKIFAVGTNKVFLTSYNNGCRDTTSQMVRTIGTGALYLYAIQCPPSLDVKFTNLSVGATSELWSFGDGTTSASMASSITHTYPALGTYTCTLSTYDSLTGCVDSFRQTFTLTNSRPSLYVADTTLCTGQRAIIIGSFSGNATAYSWSLDDVPLRRRDTVRHLFLNLTPGYHTITFRDVFKTLGTDTVTCIDSIRRVNHIYLFNPVASMSATPLTGCVPLPVTFTSNSTFTPGAGALKLKWDYGDGGKDSGLTNPVFHTYVSPGVFTVQLTATDSNGCTATAVNPFYIDARKIAAAFTANKTMACAGELLQFTGSISTGAYPLRYFWRFGDGATSTQDNPSHAYATTGNYTVQLIATDSVTGCADTLTRIAYISITKPRASFTMSDTFGICAPMIVNFTSTATGAATYAWTFGDGNSSALANPTNTYVAPGIFSVRLVVKDAAGCVDSSAISTVRVLGYAGALTYAPLIGCEPLTVRFRALITNAPSLIWDFSDGVTALATGDTISHTYLTRGAYVPKLIFSNNAGCTSSSVGLDTIKVDGVTAGFRMSPACVNSYISFYDTSRGFFLNPILSQWTFDSGQVKTGNPVTWVYPSVGEYVVTLKTVNWNNCRDSITKRLTILPLPVVTASGDTVVCIPDAAMLNADGAVTYTWAPGATLNCTACRNPMAAPVVPTAYVVSGADANGCVNTDTVRIGLQRQTSFSSLDSGALCAGQSFQLHAKGATLYHWSPDSSLDNPNIADPLATPTRSTTYMVVAKEGSCLSDTLKVRLTVNPLPLIDAGSDERIVAGSSTQLQASGTGIHHLLWSPDSVLECNTCYAPSAKPLETTTFHLTAYSAKGCIATDSVTIHVLCDGSQLFLPNTFSPNGDGLNDYFYPRGKGIPGIVSFRIFSRWGELLYERENIAANDEYAGWNGTGKGKMLAPDVYVYLIVASCGSGEHITLKGDITLMR